MAKQGALAMRRAAAQKAQATSAKLYGPNGSMRGRERHKVKSVAEILDRLRRAASFAAANKVLAEEGLPSMQQLLERPE